MVDIDEEATLLVASLFAHNATLRTIHISRCYFCIDFMPGASSHGWLVALRKNETLEELTPPFDIWRSVQWRLFFETFSTKSSLKRVSIGALYMESAHFCNTNQVLIESGAERKVRFVPNVYSSWCLGNFDLLRTRSSTSVFACFDGEEMDALQLQQRSPFDEAEMLGGRILSASVHVK